MATIIEFRDHAQSRAERQSLFVEVDRSRSAEVIIFPGIRIDRYGDFDVEGETGIGRSGSRSRAKGES